MSAYREWRERVAKAWNDPADTSHENLWRALASRPALPPEVLEARRVYEEDCEQFYEDRKAGDQAAIDRNALLMSEATQAECAAGEHRYCVHEKAHDDTEYMSPMGYAAEPRGVVWGTLNSDGSVTARGFRDDESYSDDSAVHPAVSLVAYHAEDNTWVHMATGQTVAKQREIDAKRAERGRAQAPPHPPATAGATTSEGGAAMSHASEGNAQIQQAKQDIEGVNGALQEVVNQLNAALQNLLGAADESQHSEAEAAKAALQQAVTAAEELQQTVGAAQQAVEDVRL